MVPDGSDTVQICPDEAVAYYLQGFQMVPEMVQDGSGPLALMTRWHTLRKPVAMLDATLWGLALRLIALMRARYSGKAQNSVQNETSRVCVLGGT